MQGHGGRCRPDLLRGSLRALGEGQLARDGVRLRAGSRGLARQVLRHPAQGGAVELLAVLPRRGLGGRQPVAVHRRRAARGAEVLPRHPAGRRGAPRDLLQALHARGGGRGRRLDRLRARGDPRRADLRLHQDVRAPRPRHRRAAARPLAHQARAGGGDVPRDRRGDARPAGPALHRGLPDRAGRAAGVPRGDAQRVARRAAPHRLRGEAAARPGERGPRRAGGDRRPAAPGAPAHGRRVRAAELGPPLLGVLRLHARGHLRGGREVVRGQAARRRGCRSRTCPGRCCTRSTCRRASARCAGWR